MKNAVVNKTDQIDMMPKERYLYDLSHWNMSLGAIGSLQTEKVIFTLPGDSIDIDWRSVNRLSPLRRAMSADAIVHKFAFWVPMRHIYPNWADFIKDGYDESVTLGTYSTSASTPIYSTGFPIPGGTTIPKWLIVPYMKVWNRFFKLPTDADYADDYLLTASEQMRYYGLPCGHEKAIWNTGLTDTMSAADSQYTVSGSVVSLPDLELTEARLKTELIRDYTANRYREVLGRIWGTDVNIDADQRPSLLAHTKQWLSGYDVNATDSAGLGAYSGRALGQSLLKFPPKFFPEHGVILLLSLVRFPPLHPFVTNYLPTKSEPSYAEIAGDPEVIKRSPPVSSTIGDFQFGGGATGLGKIPFGNWFRSETSSIHYKYYDVGGHPFVNSPISAKSDVTYIASTVYDSVFDTGDLKHWNSQSYVQAFRRSFVPPAEQSIFAGTEL